MKKKAQIWSIPVTSLPTHIQLGFGDSRVVWADASGSVAWVPLKGGAPTRLASAPEPATRLLVLGDLLLAFSASHLSLYLSDGSLTLAPLPAALADARVLHHDPLAAASPCHRLLLVAAGGALHLYSVAHLRAAAEASRGHSRAVDAAPLASTALAGSAPPVGLSLLAGGVAVVAQADGRVLLVNAAALLRLHGGALVDRPAADAAAERVCAALGVGARGLLLAVAHARGAVTCVAGSRDAEVADEVAEAMAAAIRAPEAPGAARKVPEGEGGGASVPEQLQAIAAAASGSRLATSASAKTHTHVAADHRMQAKTHTPPRNSPSPQPEPEPVPSPARDAASYAARSQDPVSRTPAPAPAPAPASADPFDTSSLRQHITEAVAEAVSAALEPHTRRVEAAVAAAARQTQAHTREVVSNLHVELVRGLHEQQQRADAARAAQEERLQTLLARVEVLRSSNQWR
jgi:hypothetical protein